MTKLLTLHIPIKPFLKKYLIQKFGAEHCVSRRSWLGRYLIDLLDKQYRKSTDDIKIEEYYPVSIPTSIVKDVGFDISGKKLKQLSEMIYKVFVNDLYSYIEVSVSSNLKFENERNGSINKQNVLKAIDQFLNHYSISEDEISKDTIYRNFHRYKKTDKSSSIASPKY